MCSTVIKKIFSLHPVKFAVVVLMLGIAGVALANLTSHTEALVDSILLALDPDADGTPIIQEVSDATTPTAVTISGDSAGNLGVGGALAVGQTNQNQLIAAMNTGMYLDISAIGDSTGSAISQWVYLWLELLGAKLPEYTIEYHVWNHSYQDFNGGIELQQSSLGESCIEFTGSDSDKATVADAAITNPTGDVDFRFKIKPDAWPPTDVATFLDHQAGAGDRGYTFTADTDGRLVWWWSENGTDRDYDQSSVVATISTGSASFVRVTHDLDNGSGGNDVRFYTSTDGISWAQVGTTVTNAGTVAALYDTTGSWAIGGTTYNDNPFDGKIYEVDLRGGINAWPPLNFQKLNEWTLNNNATLNGGPVLRVWNGHRGGADVAYIDDGTRRLQIRPVGFGPILTLVNLSHNNYGETTTFLSAYQTLIENLISDYAYSQVVLVTQNPEMSPETAGNIAAHEWQRLYTILLARHLGLQYVDIYRVFEIAGVNSTYINDADGVHPTAAGQVLWANAINDWFLNQIPY